MGSETPDGLSGLGAAANCGPSPAPPKFTLGRGGEGFWAGPNSDSLAGVTPEN